MIKQGFNPFLPSYEYIPDGEPYVFGERVYIYGSHDKFNGDVYCQNNYVCWSAPVDDLTQWQYEGLIYDKTKDPMCDDPNKRQLYAPDVQQGIDGRYYLYYAFDFSGVMAVAVCESPAGEFEFYGHVHYKDGSLLGNHEGEIFHFDPGVLVDNDERVFLYSGFCPVYFPWQHVNKPEQNIKGAVVIELEKDMITIKQDPKVVAPYFKEGKGTSFEGHEFFEASSIRKINDTYYFIYSSINGHELCYATSKRPDGGFVYGGTIVSNGDIYLDGRTDEMAQNYTGNNHGSIIDINGQWYVFYHRHTNKHQFSRQACAEKIYIESDGSIKQVEMTSCGLNNGPLTGKGLYEARIACVLKSKFGAKRYEFGAEIESYHPYFTQDGEDRESEPNQYIANMVDGAIAGYKYFDFKDVSSIIVVIRGNGKGQLVLMTKENGDPIEKIDVDVTNEKQWVEISSKLTLQNRILPIYFQYLGTGSIDILSFEFI